MAYTPAGVYMPDYPALGLVAKPKSNLFHHDQGPYHIHCQPTTKSSASPVEQFDVPIHTKIVNFARNLRRSYKEVKRDPLPH